MASTSAQISVVEQALPQARAALATMKYLR
jgi:hypothetical protein